MEMITRQFKHNDYSIANTEEPNGSLEINKTETEEETSIISKRSFILLSCLILGIILAFTLITFFALYFFSANNKNDGLSLPTESGLVLISENIIWFYDPKINQFTQLIESANDIQAFDIYRNESIVWNEDNEPMIKFSSTKYTNITHANKLIPQAIAVDHVTGNVYMIHKSTGTLNIIDKKGKHYNIVLSDLKNPHDLAMDVEDGLIFITQRTESIIRVSMDGTNLTKIIDDEYASLLTIDHDNKRLYWTSDTHLMSSNYDGSEIKNLMEYAYSLKGLAFYNGKLFWLMHKSRLANATLAACKIYMDECKEYSNHPIPFENPRLLKVYHHDYDTERIIDDPCSDENCSHLCLLTKNRFPKCACKLGWQLNNDLKTCQPITEFSMFVVGNVIRTQTLENRNNGSFTDVFQPLAFDIGSSNYKEMIHFDFHLKTNNFYFSNDRWINRINLLDDEKQSVAYEVDPGYTITDIAIDWLSDNLFYVKKSNSSYQSHSIMVMNLNNYNLHKTIESFPVTLEVLGGCPHSLIVHPNLSKLFFTLFTNEETNLQSIDITNPSESIKGGIIEYYNKYNILGLDYELERIYYPRYRNLTGTNKRYISIVDLYLRSEKLLILPFSITEIISLYVYGENIYIGNEEVIWRFNKSSGRDLEKIYPRFGYESDGQKLSLIKIFGPKIQSVNDEDYCKINDCEQFCFAKPQKTCGCVDVDEMKDNRRCLRV